MGCEIGTRPLGFSPERSWCEPAERFQDGSTPKLIDPFDTAPKRQGGVILASILRRFGPEMAQKRLKMGQN
jgi:hypothetical protein